MKKSSIINYAHCLLMIILLSVCQTSFSSPELLFTDAANQIQATNLLQVPFGQSLVLNNITLDGESTPIDLKLERFEVFAPDTRIVVRDAQGHEKIVPHPVKAYFRGKIAGISESLVVLSANSTDAIRGLVQQEKKLWIVAGGIEAGGPTLGLATREIWQSGALAGLPKFNCGVEGHTKELTPPTLSKSLRLITQAAAPLPAGQFYEVKVAIETDGEFYSLFGDTNAATNYIGDLFAYASTIYYQEASAKLIVSHVSLWSGGPASDPWNHTSTNQGLSDFQSYWNTNNTTINRTLAHFLSGRNLGGGIAYVDVLCNGTHGYGYSAGLDGQFQISNPQPVWDIIVVAHEIGHNFGSDHTHCYMGIGGNSNPVDACYAAQSACWNGTTSLPGVNSLTGGSPGSGNGTIMSYCHLLSGGMANISLTLGQSHPYGIAADRVSTLIAANVANAATNNPSCITIGTDSSSYLATVTKTGTGSGGVISISPPGIACGATCSASFGSGVVLTLTAAADPGSTFTGWSGDCSGASDCTVTMSADRNVTATFDANTSTSYTLTTATTGTGAGTVTSNPSGINCGADCTESYTDGQTVTLTATPNAGSTFTGWSGACSGTGACTVTMSADRNVTASFTLASVVTQTLKVGKTGTGQGSVTSSDGAINCGTLCQAGYPANTTVTLTATPAPGSSFLMWRNSCIGTNPTTTVKMSTGRYCVAIFR